MFDRLPAEREARSWLYVAVWSGIIFVSIPFAPDIVRAVRRTFGGEAIVATSISISAVAFIVIVALLIRRGRTDRSGYIWLTATGVVLLLLLTWFRSPYPAETLHYVQYGVLGVLLFRALSHRIRNYGIYPLALIIGTAIGTLDEIVQWLTPGRFFEMADIALNFTGVALAQVVLATAVRPAIISGWPDATEQRRIGALAMVLVGLLSLCAVLIA